MLAAWEALQFLQRAGWTPQSSRVRIFDIASATEDGFAISRIMHDQGTFHRVVGRAEMDRPPGVVVMFQLDGRAVVETRDAGTVTLSPGHVLITPDDAHLSYTSKTVAARIEVAFGLPSPDFAGRSIVGSMDSTMYTQLMIGSVNEVLNNQHSIAEAGLLRLRLALWEFVSAIRDVLAPRSDAPPPRARKLYDEATRRIGYARSDQPMSVRQLCASLHVSERHLRTVFSVHGDSPSGLIRRIRVYRTAVVLRGDAPVSTRGIDELARSLGYSGRRQMRRELRNLVASTHELDQPVRIVLLSLPSETRTLIGV